VTAEQEKLARWSAAVSDHVRVDTVSPNLTVGGVAVDEAPDSGDALRYQVNDGAGFPPLDVHVS